MTMHFLLFVNLCLLDDLMVASRGWPEDGGFEGLFNMIKTKFELWDIWSQDVLTSIKGGELEQG